MDATPPVGTECHFAHTAAADVDGIPTVHTGTVIDHTDQGFPIVWWSSDLERYPAVGECIGYHLDGDLRVGIVAIVTRCAVFTKISWAIVAPHVDTVIETISYHDNGTIHAGAVVSSYRDGTTIARFNAMQVPPVGSVVCCWDEDLELYAGSVIGNSTSRPL